MKGLFGKPTLVNNAETLNIVNAGIVEVPMGMSLREIVFDIGGGCASSKAFKVVQTGEPSGDSISHEPKSLGELFRDLECELQTAAISMERFLQILTAVANNTKIVKENKDLLKIITLMRAYAQKELGFMCES
jgi:NADH:ubiquinone oxidoreductase subunit F (NADH-binding)